MLARRPLRPRPHEPTSTPTRPRWVEIDLLKGLAILWVLLIHSRALGDSFIFLNVVNRAVPLFVIVFGLNSTLWWRSRAFPEPSVAHSSRGAGMRSSAAIPDR